MAHTVSCGLQSHYNNLAICALMAAAQGGCCSPHGLDRPAAWLGLDCLICTGTLATAGEFLAILVHGAVRCNPDTGLLISIAGHLFAWEGIGQV